MKPNIPKTLNNKHKIAAMLEARGQLSRAEIAEYVDLTVARMMIVRRSPDYKALVVHHQKEIEERHYDAAANLQSKFDEEAPEAFKTLASLNEKADRDTTRLGAAKELLDRSSIAPSKQVIQGETGGVVIQIGIKKLEQIYAALEDVGDCETIQLLEEEYEEVPEST